MTAKFPALPDIGHFIGGEYFSGHEDTWDNTCPADGTPLGTIPIAGSREVELAVEAARSCQSGGFGRLPVQERAQMLLRLADLLEANLDWFAALEAADTGKPLQETTSGDIARAIHNFRFFAELPYDQAKTWKDATGWSHQTTREPIGIVGLITPWNLPLYLSTWKLAPALLQGNSVILKPAEWTPLTAMALGDLINQAGFPPGAVNVLQGLGAGSTGEHIVRHPDIKAISFTGETGTGKAIAAAAAPHLKKLSFELGGKGASVITPSANLPEAISESARAAFRNQGQICLAGSRIIVHESVADQVIQGVVDYATSLQIGHPIDPGTQFGSLIHKDHQGKVASFGELAKQEANVRCGGSSWTKSTGAYYMPTVVTDVKQGSSLIQDEIFGPIAMIQTYREFSDAIEMVNGTRYGLSTSIWSTNQSETETFQKNVRMGLVWTNCWFKRDLHAAFGGMKQSGIGREGGDYSLDFFSEHKTITWKGE